MPYGLPSIDEQIAVIRDASDNGVAIVHIDTCLPSFLTDHHNRDGEALFGVYVDGTTTNKSVRKALAFEMTATGDDRIPAYVTDDMLYRAASALFADVDHDTLFDASLDVLDEDDAETIGGDELAQAWFLLTWTHKPYVSFDIRDAAGHLVHNVIVTDEERAAHLSDYDDGSHVWTETGRYSEEEADDMTYTDRGLAHLDEEGGDAA